MSDGYVPGPAEYARPDDPLAQGVRWRRERDEARAEVERLNTALDNMRAEYMTNLNCAEAEVERLREALRMEGHGPTCRTRIVEGECQACEALESTAKGSNDRRSA